MVAVAAAMLAGTSRTKELATKLEQFAVSNLYNLFACQHSNSCFSEIPRVTTFVVLFVNFAGGGAT